MISSNIENYQQYIFNENFELAFKFLMNTNLLELPLGKTELSESVYIIRDHYNTKKLGETFWESHNQYIDIQFIIKGEEKIAHAPSQHLTKVLTKEENDVNILMGPVRSFLHLIENDFAIFFPEDAHMPGLNTDLTSNKMCIRDRQDG